MPVTTIHISSEMKAIPFSILADDVRNAVSTALQIPASAPVVFIYDTSPERRCIHPDRVANLVYAETVLKSGRTLELKVALHKAVKAAIMKHTQLPKDGIVSILIESPGEDIDLG